MDAQPDFRTWPKRYQNPESEDVKILASLHAEEIEIYKYSQFCIHEQQLLNKRIVQ